MAHAHTTTYLALGIVACFAGVGCGSRSIGSDYSEAGGANQSRVCHLESNWERRFSGEPGLLLDQGVLGPDGPVLAGRHFQDFAESTAVLGFSLSGAERFRRRLDGRSPKLAQVAQGTALARSLKNDLVVSLHAADGGTSAEAHLGSEDEDSAHVVVPAADGFLVVSTAAHYPSSLGDVQAMRFSANGSHLWQQTWKTQQKLELRVIGAFADAKGNAVVAIHRWLNGGHGPVWLVALHPNGHMRWQYTDSVHLTRGAVQVLLQTNSGGAVVVGSIDDGSGVAGGPARALHLNASGDVVWARSFDDGSGNQQLVSDGIQLSDGSFAFIGYSANSAQGRLWRVRADGTVAWARDYAEVGAGLAKVRALPGGGFVVGAARWSLTSEDLYEVVQLDAEGEILRRHRADGEGVAQLGALDVDAAGRVLAVGWWSKDQARQSHVMLLSEICGVD